MEKIATKCNYYEVQFRLYKGENPGNVFLTCLMKAYLSFPLKYKKELLKTVVGWIYGETM